MAGLPWYGLWTNFPRHAKTRALAAALRDDNAGMYVIRLFSHCAEEALDGRVSTAAVEGIVEWKKRRGVLLAALQATGFLELNGDGFCTVHGWEERNGARIRKAIADNARPNASQRGKRGTPMAPPAEEAREPDETPTPTPTKPRAGFALGDGRRETEETAAAADARAAREAAPGSAAEDAGGEPPRIEPASSAPEASHPGTTSPGSSAEWAADEATSPAPAVGGHGVEAAAQQAGGEGTKAGPSSPVRELRRAPDFAAMDSDLRPPCPTVVDRTYPATEKLRLRLARELREPGKEIVPIGKLARDEDRELFEAKIRDLGEDAVAEVCVEKARRAGVKPGNLAWWVGPVGDMEKAPESKPEPAADPQAEWDAALERHASRCRLWGIMLRRAASRRVPLAERVKWLAGVEASLSGGTLTLRAPNPHVATWLDVNREHLEYDASDASKEPVKVSIVMAEPQAAAGGVA